MSLSFVSSFSLLSSRFHRSVCSAKTSLTLPSMFTGLAILESPAVMLAANAGILLSTVLNVQLPCQLMVLCTWGNQRVRIFTASTILRVTATRSTKARCAWDSGSLIVPDSVEVMTPTLDTTQCPGSLLKKFLNLRLRSRAYNGTVVYVYCGFLLIFLSALYFFGPFAGVK